MPSILEAPEEPGFHVLWFSRGRGRAHAAADTWIAREVLAKTPDISVRFVSYADGAGVFRACGVLAADWQLDRLIVASDAVITKGTRKTLYQVAALGAPSLAISDGLNWPDDVVAAHLPSNTLVFRETLSSDRLAELIVEKISRGWLAEELLPQWEGVSGAAQIIAAEVNALRKA